MLRIVSYFMYYFPWRRGVRWFSALYFFGGVDGLPISYLWGRFVSGLVVRSGFAISAYGIKLSFCILHYIMGNVFMRLDFLCLAGGALDFTRFGLVYVHVRYWS